MIQPLIVWREEEHDYVRLLGGFSVPDQRRLGSGEDDPRRPTADLRTLPPRPRWAHGGVVSHRPAVSEVGR